MGEKTQQLNIAIGVPSQDTVYARTMASIAFNMIASKGAVTDLYLRQGSDIVSARTWIIQKAIEDKKTHVLFVDSDMIFPPETLNTLLESDKDIIGVEYNMRKFPETPTWDFIEDAPRDKPYQIVWCGTGLMLINMRIFDKMTKPWFNNGRDVNGQLSLGEDAWFCHTARDNGYEVWIEPRLKIGHIGSYIY